LKAILLQGGFFSLPFGKQTTMSNSYFQFKQFTVHQDKCAMKVCTDACLFGAWVASKIGNKITGVNHVLDIGAGTGLLSLIIAQKTNNTIIEAVEIDKNAAAQARENFISSPWHNRMNVIEGDIKTIQLSSKYDLVISNPPFYENDLKSPDNAKNIAHHSADLSLLELIGIAKKLLTPKGKIAILLPSRRAADFEKQSTNADFFIEQKTLVKQTEKHEPFRVMYLLGMTEMNIKTDYMSIKQKEHYTPEFISLLKEFYL
jgi:tRNA1Val (adenine37-N6)-methyltransferase